MAGQVPKKAGQPEDLKSAQKWARKAKLGQLRQAVEGGQDRQALQEGNSSQCRAARTISKTILVPFLRSFSLVHGANKRSFLQEV